MRQKLSSRELESADLGFKQLLRRKGFSRAFVGLHAADLLAQARLEYVRKVAAGNKISNPAGWIVHCAWRRTQNLLTAKSRGPDLTSLEEHVVLADGAPKPEEMVLTEDRYHQLQAAVQQLPLEERQVIALTYFEGMSTREASRTLGWGHDKGDHHHHDALTHLYELLGVKDADALQVEAGLVAWMSIAASGHVGPIERASESVHRAMAEVLVRAHELARRLIAGGAAEPGAGNAAGAVARTAGVCGAAAVACLASGVIGPGAGGVDLIGHPSRQEPEVTRQRAAPMPVQMVSTPAEAPSTSTSATDSDQRSKGRKREQSRASGKQAATPQAARAQPVGESEPAPTSSGAQAEETFAPFTSDGSNGSGGSTAPSAGPAQSRPGESTAGSAPKASGQQVEAEFGL